MRSPLFSKLYSIMIDVFISESLRNLTLTGVVPVGRDLGRGAYGEVVEVKYREKNYAAKEIHTILLEETTPEEKRKVEDNFLQECRICRSLNHPNIVSFVGIYYPRRDSVLPAMVMELMDTSLTEYVKRPTIGVKTKISILHDVSSGLSYLHNHTPPIIHHNLSPNNVLLSCESIAKIGDLGVVKVIKANGKMSNKLTKAPGSVDFMSPEAVDNNPVYNTSLDVFSFGGITLHVINQEWPSPMSSTAFDTECRRFTEVERRQIHLDKITGKIVALKPLIIDCLDNDPVKRPVITTILSCLESLSQPSQPSNNLSSQQDVLHYYTDRELHHIADYILSFLDAKSLCQAELVCVGWKSRIADGMLWKKLIEKKAKTNSLWKGLSVRRGWDKYLFGPLEHSDQIMQDFFRKLYPSIITDITNIESNWKCGRHKLTRIQCHSEGHKGAYCLQYDDKKIISGLRNDTIKIWKRDTLLCTKILRGHTGSVLCLQYDENVIVTGSSDSTIRIWDIECGTCLRLLEGHNELVRCISFDDKRIVSGAYDGSIKVWDFQAALDPRAPISSLCLRTFAKHTGRVFQLQFDDFQIVSSANDDTILIWDFLEVDNTTPLL
ncbi:uncharacterized protein [Dysidea avara]|uniref:uncharacterized protein isoform X2 n=1 Tax=Dysidea avara TaxID=196820 RepID=UPI00332FA4DC